MMASSSAITTRMVTVFSSAFRAAGEPSAAFGRQPVEQLVLAAFELVDGRGHLGSVAVHGISVLLRLVVLLVRDRCLGDERPKPGVFRGIGERVQLLVGDEEL